MNTKPAILCDLDGVVWLARNPLDGASEAVANLRNAGHRVVFVTNNSFATLDQQEKYLFDAGIPANGDLVTSAMAAASLLEPQSRVLVCGGPGLVEAVRKRGAQAVEMDTLEESGIEVDAVVVGFHTSFDYRSLRLASRSIRHGARFVASNDDPTYPTPDGPIPGGGSIVAAVATASGSAPEIAGKPHLAMASLIRSSVPELDGRSIMIGDRPSTDGLFAARLNCRFALVRSDVTREEEAYFETQRMLSRPYATFAGNSLRDVASAILASPETR